MLLTVWEDNQFDWVVSCNSQRYVFLIRCSTRRKRIFFFFSEKMNLHELLWIVCIRNHFECEISWNKDRVDDFLLVLIPENDQRMIRTMKWKGDYRTSLMYFWWKDADARLSRWEFIESGGIQWWTVRCKGEYMPLFCRMRHFWKRSSSFWIF